MLVREPEMALRRLKLKASSNGWEQGYLTGYFNGIDYARKQAVVIFIIAVIFMKLFGWV